MKTLISLKLKKKKKSINKAEILVLGSINIKVQTGSAQEQVPVHSPRMSDTQ